MYKNKLFYIATILVMAFASCSGNREGGSDNGPMENIDGLYTLEAEYVSDDNRMNLTEDDQLGIKSTWEEGDVIMLFSGNTYAATFILTSGENDKVGVFTSTGVGKLTAGNYRAVAMSAEKYASLIADNKPTTYPPVPTSYPFFVTQTGNTSMDHISKNFAILRSVADVTYASGVEGPNPGPTHTNYVGLFKFKLTDMAVISTKFTLPDNEIPLYVSLTTKSDLQGNGSIVPPTYIINMEGVTAGQQIIANIAVLPNTELIGPIELDVFTAENGTDNYQVLIESDDIKTGKLTAGVRYLREIKSAEWSTDPKYYLSVLNANITLMTTNADAKAKFATEDEQYQHTIPYLAKRNLNILDSATPVLSATRFSPNLRKAFNKRNLYSDATAKMLNVTFPNIVGFPNGGDYGITSVSAGAFAYVETVSHIDAPDANGRIGDYTFAGTKNLDNPNFAKITTVGRYAFSNSDIKNIDFRECTTLEEYAMANTYNIENLKLPKLTKFGNYAFILAQSNATSEFNLEIGTEVPTTTSVYAGFSAFNRRFGSNFIATDYGGNVNNTSAAPIHLTLGTVYAVNGNKPNSNSTTADEPKLTYTWSCGGGNQTCNKPNFKVGGNSPLSSRYMRVTETTTSPGTAVDGGVGVGTDVGYYWWVNREYKTLYVYNSGGKGGYKEGYGCYSDPNNNNIYCTAIGSKFDKGFNTAYGKFASITIVEPTVAP